MNRDYTVTYNGQSALDLGLVVEHRPTIPSAVPNVTEFDIPSRDGTLHRSDGTVQDVEFPVSFAFVVDDPDDWLSMFRTATSWLYGTGDHRLIFSEDPNWFYDVVSVTVSDAPERVAWNGGRFEATFKVRGYAYLLEGFSPTADLVNHYDICRPIYIIIGDTNGTLTVNGKSVTINIGQQVTIDTDLMITYRESGAIQNTAITGNYEDLWLSVGNNSVTVSSGLSVSVIPRWRKRL